MKNLIAFFVSIFASVSFGSTTVPVQLINPTGSSSGQAIVSTGASSAPAWGGVGLNGIAAIAANTVIGNATGSTASPTAITVTGCNGAAQALQWTNGSGFGCNSGIATSGANANITSLSGLSTPLSVAQGGTGLTTIASHSILSGNGTSAISQIGAGTTGQMLLGVTSGFPIFGNNPTITGGTIDGAPIGGTTAASGKFTTLQATSTITPSTTAGIVGTTAADNAQAGSVGEFLNNSTTGTAITTGTTVNATSISLTAGDYNCWGQALFLPVATTIVANIAAGITTTSATLPASPDTTYLGTTLTTGTNGTTAINPMIKRINIASTTTVYLVAEAGSVTVSTATVAGYIQCRRIR